MEAKSKTKKMASLAGIFPIQTKAPRLEMFKMEICCCEIGKVKIAYFPPETFEAKFVPLGVQDLKLLIGVYYMLLDQGDVVGSNVSKT